LQQSSEKEDAPIGTPPRPDRTEPNVWESVGSSVCFSAVRIRFSDDAKRLIIEVRRGTDSSNADKEAPGRSKPARRPEGVRQELGQAAGSQWVKRSEAPARERETSLRSGAERCGREGSPSAGWRETAERLDAAEGVSHR
jgi:hypothetical protein